MKQNFPFAWIAIIGCCLVTLRCQQIPAPLLSTYTFIEPTYDNIQLLPQNDSLHFALDSISYNEISSFNYFTYKGRSFIAFFDKNTRSLNTYDLNTQQLVHKLPLKKKIPEESFKKASTFAVNFDSIFVITNQSLSLVDSSGSIKQKFALFDSESEKPTIDIETPAILINKILYTGVSPFSDETSLKTQKKWNVVSGFDLQNNTKQLYYQLPSIYQKDLYGYSFLEYSYCMNDRGRFVFSFAADTNIYETNFSDYNNAYFAKSKFQTGTILPVPQKIIDKGESRKEYYLRDAYGTIYFDPHQKRYLRFAKQKIRETDFLANKKERKRSVIVFNEDFKIIGESTVSDTMAFKSIFFAPEGGMYVRVKVDDEHALHFVRLDYSDKQYHSERITQHKPLPKK